MVGDSFLIELLKRVLFFCRGGFIFRLKGAPWGSSALMEGRGRFPKNSWSLGGG